MLIAFVRETIITTNKTINKIQLNIVFLFCCSNLCTSNYQNSDCNQWVQFWILKIICL